MYVSMCASVCAYVCMYICMSMRNHSRIETGNVLQCFIPVRK